MGDRRACTLNSIHNGDTACVTCDCEAVKIRFDCIDAPEIAHASGLENCDYLRRIAPAQSD